MTNLTTNKAIEFWNYLFKTPWINGFIVSHKGPDVSLLEAGMNREMITFYRSGEFKLRSDAASFLREVAEALELENPNQ